MIKRSAMLAALALSGVLLGGCGMLKTASNDNGAPGRMPDVIVPSRVTAVGYGAMPNMDGLTMAQRRMLAMRASKLDAYRALAETVQGLRLTGQSTVSALALQNDSFRYYVDAYLRGARVLSVNPLPDGAYETVLELQLNGDFVREAGSAQQGMQVEAPKPEASKVEAPAPKPEAAATPTTSKTVASNFYYAK
ncbi:hypothetical protein SAMN02745857_03327 [Andreprevotia lacus DSM 23236]|jgi:hypothetical protein|uniref:Lipoprotein LPP20-like domain-containing protein n=1 Tax=Andreprevotia lacus DSM 23236 TaxID=1121001 RepID=A0A1W1XX68_9NEIS|nr:LPP20 family lipoprotein [Andreprevotia lacus]SMC28580.1 hypothetical protein SAMN02745857_03327 [Andreprevotia lacus DSM 23236]